MRSIFYDTELIFGKENKVGIITQSVWVFENMACNRNFPLSISQLDPIYKKKTALWK